MSRSRLYGGKQVRLGKHQYHRQGHPRWWAYTGSGEDRQWASIPPVRGDRELNVVVDLPPGTPVCIGTGHRYWGILATVCTIPIDSPLPIDSPFGD